ncbi:unnamed protein product [Rhizoctonia solani]|uniref:Uncharacterized protein n=1 Tax=Rhizoctonia solani TaxID=456999 RepID=A0A8H3EBT6_9AGAM|nr:unnamed protein product [Rhizoctonia solani]
MNSTDKDEKLFREIIELKAHKLAVQANKMTSGQEGTFETLKARGETPIVLSSSDEYEPDDDQSSSLTPLSPHSIAKEPRSPTGTEPTIPEPTTYHSLRQRNHQARRASSPQHFPSPLKRDRSYSPSPSPEPPKRRRSSPSKARSSLQAQTHPYDICPTSYQPALGKRGGRFSTVINGVAVKAQTLVEQLGDRHLKYEHVREHGHLFGDKYRCYFNPYSYSPINSKTFMMIGRPVGMTFQLCAKGKQFHELIGLRDDYMFRIEIARVARNTLHLFAPEGILKSGKPLLYKDYDSLARAKIHNFMYQHYPFLYHFRDMTGEGNWAIDGMCGIHLYTKTGQIKAKGQKYSEKSYFKPDKGEHRGKSEKGPSDQGIPCGYEDDYALYARDYSTPGQSLSLTGSRTQPYPYVHSRSDGMHQQQGDSLHIETLLADSATSERDVSMSNQKVDANVIEKRACSRRLVHVGDGVELANSSQDESRQVPATTFGWLSSVVSASWGW